MAPSRLTKPISVVRTKNKHAKKKLHAGRGTVGKIAVAGIKDRPTNEVQADVVADVKRETLEEFVEHHAEQDAVSSTLSIQVA